MKLKTFNIENCKMARQGRVSKPSIYLSQKSGLFKVNKAGIDLMDLKVGQQVVLHQDETEEGDWYLEIVKDGGFPVRSSKKNKTEVVVFNSKRLSVAIAESVAFIKNCGTILLPKEPVKFEKRTLWPLLTSCLKN